MSAARGWPGCADGGARAARKGKAPAWAGSPRGSLSAAAAPAAAARRTFDPANAQCGGAACCFLKKDSGYTLLDKPGLVSGSY